MWFSCVVGLCGKVVSLRFAIQLCGWIVWLSCVLGLVGLELLWVILCVRNCGQVA